MQAGAKPEDSPPSRAQNFGWDFGTAVDPQVSSTDSGGGRTSDHPRFAEMASGIGPGVHREWATAAADRGSSSGHDSDHALGRLHGGGDQAGWATDIDGSSGCSRVDTGLTIVRDTSKWSSM